MKDIVDEIDKALVSSIGKGKYYGLCKLVIDSNETYPVTDGITREKVTPNDLYKLAIYHRRLDSSINPDEDNSFGRTLRKRNDQKLRTVVLIEEKSGITIEDVYNALPDFLTIEDKYKSIHIQSDISLIFDHDAVWETEWPAAYKDKYQLRYKVYALEYIVEYITCENVCN